MPPDYYPSNRRYPVVYLLHGYSDDETGWTQFGEADRLIDATQQSILDKAVAELVRLTRAVKP